MDEQGRYTAAVTAVFLLLTAALIAYNVLNVPPLSPNTAEVASSITSSMAKASSLSTSPEESLLVSVGAVSSAQASSTVPSSQPALSAPSDVSSAPSSRTVQSAPSSQAGTSSVAKRTTPPDRPDIDLNTATAEELCVIPKIGPVLAGRIIEYRDTYGPLSSLEELLDVKGIGDKLYKTLCQYVYLG